MNDKPKIEWTVGERVAVWSSRYQKYPGVSTITKITPTGRLKIAGYEASQFGPDGYIMGDRDAWSYLVHVEKITDALVDLIQRGRAIREIQALDLEGLPTDLLTRIAETIKRARQ